MPSRVASAGKAPSGAALCDKRKPSPASNWQGLTCFLEDVLAGHDEGAFDWACARSLIETAKLSQLNSQAYLAGVLTKRVNGWPMKKLHKLLPLAWSAQGGGDKQAG